MSDNPYMAEAENEALKKAALDRDNDHNTIDFTVRPTGDGVVFQRKFIDGQYPESAPGGRR